MKKNLKIALIFSTLVLILASISLIGLSADECDITPPNSKVTVDALGFRYPAMEYIMKEMSKCGEVDNVKINSNLVAWSQLEQKSHITLTAGGTAPYDLLHAYNRTLVEYASKGWLAPLNKYVEKYKDRYNLNDIPGSLWEAVSYQGKIYGFPFQQNVQIIFYRKDIFKDLGLEPPKTHQELLEVTRTLKKEASTPIPVAMVYGKPHGLFTEFHGNLMAYGGKWLNEEGLPAFNSEAGVKAVKYMKKVYELMPKGALTYTNDDVMVALQQGKAAMGKIWVSRAPSMSDPKVSRVVGKMGYSASPVVEGIGIPSTNWTQDMFVVPKNVGADKGFLFKVLAETFDKKSLKGAAGMTLVSRESIAKDEEIVNEYPYYPAALETLKKGAKAYPKKAYIGVFTDIVGNHVSKVLMGNMKAEKALDKAAKKVTETLKSKGYIE